MRPHEEMLMAILNCRRIDLYTKQVMLDSAQEQKYHTMQKRFDQGDPLQYILGSVEFLGLNLHIDKRVLIPRPETELMVDAAISRIRMKFGNKKIKIIDLGTGSGNIAVALAFCLPNSEVVAVDVSPLALELALQNARFNKVSDRVRFVCEDMKKYLETRASSEGPFDVIISNPPYVRYADLAKLPADVKKEPRLALDGGEDGLRFYRYIISGVESNLCPEGMVFFEFGDDQGNEIKQMIEQTKMFAMIQLIKDFSSVERFVIAERVAITAQKQLTPTF